MCTHPSAAYPFMLFDQRGNRKYLTSRERSAFISAAASFDPKICTFCLTLAYTGARISEVLALTSDRVDSEGEVIIFSTLKRRRSGVYRAVPVPPMLIRRLRTVHGSNDSTEPLWTWSRTTAWTRVKEVMERAGIQGARAMPKALRHTFGVYGLTQAQVPLNMMQKWLGHAKIETTAIYANAVGKEERAIAARMWKA